MEGLKLFAIIMASGISLGLVLAIIALAIQVRKDRDFTTLTKAAGNSAVRQNS